MKIDKNKLEETIELIQNAQKLNEAFQKKTVIGSTEWHAHETIDDKLHDALTLLGD